jgi:hypothetical protein
MRRVCTGTQVIIISKDLGRLPGQVGRPMQRVHYTSTLRGHLGRTHGSSLYTRKHLALRCSMSKQPGDEWASQGEGCGECDCTDTHTQRTLLSMRKQARNECNVGPGSRARRTRPRPRRRDRARTLHAGCTPSAPGSARSPHAFGRYNMLFSVGAMSLGSVIF